MDVQIKSSFDVALEGKFSILGLCANTGNDPESISEAGASGVL